MKSEFKVRKPFGKFKKVFKIFLFYKKPNPPRFARAHDRSGPWSRSD